MATPVPIWGIDVGRCAFKALKLRPGAEGHVDVVDQVYFEHPTMISDAEGNQYQVISEALEKFLAKKDISKEKVVVGVPGQHTLARFSKLPPVEPKKIPDIVRYEADQQIPFDLDEVIWDFQTFQEDDSPDVEVGIFAIKRDLIRNFLLPFEQVGLEPIVVQSAPLALFNAMRFEERLDEGASVLLDVGADNTNLIVATKHGLWTRTIPLGGNKFTDALVNSFKLSFAKAENLKRTAATSKYARQVFQAMRPIFAEFVQELSRSLGFYRSTHREAELKRVIGLGNAFKLPGLQKYLQQNLQLPVDKPEIFTHASMAEIGDDAEFKNQIPSFVVSYGLALQGLEQTKAMTGASAIKSNLLPPEIVKQVVWRKKKPYFAAAAACLLLASGIVWFRRQSDLGTLEAGAGAAVPAMNYQRATQILRTGVTGVPPRQEGATWLAVQKAFKSELDKYSNQGREEVEQSEQLLQLQKNKALWPKILATIHGALPEPPDPLKDVDTARDYAERLRSDDNLSRSNRPEVFIERLVTEYATDLKANALTDVVSGTAKPLIEEPEEEQNKGYIVTMRCRTPNTGKYRYVADAFKQQLEKLGQQPGMGFYFDRVVITGGMDFEDEGDRSSGRRPPPGGGRGGRGRGGRGTPPPPTQPRVDTVKKYDPVTDEPMDEDWVFEVRMAVVLADLPEQETDDTTQD